jgi:hypothetical protein
MKIEFGSVMLTFYSLFKKSGPLYGFCFVFLKRLDFDMKVPGSYLSLMRFLMHLFSMFWVSS